MDCPAPPGTEPTPPGTAPTPPGPTVPGAGEGLAPNVPAAAAGAATWVGDPHESPSVAAGAVAGVWAETAATGGFMPSVDCDAENPGATAPPRACGGPGGISDSNAASSFGIPLLTGMVAADVDP